MYFSIDRTVHTTAFDKPVVDHWLEQKIAQTAPPIKSKYIIINKKKQMLEHPNPDDEWQLYVNVSRKNTQIPMMNGSCM